MRRICLIWMSALAIGFCLGIAAPTAWADDAATGEIGKYKPIPQGYQRFPATGFWIDLPEHFVFHTEQSTIAFSRDWRATLTARRISGKFLATENPKKYGPLGKEKFRMVSSEKFVFDGRPAIWNEWDVFTRTGRPAAVMYQMIVVHDKNVLMVIGKHYGNRGADREAFAQMIRDGRWQGQREIDRFENLSFTVKTTDDLPVMIRFDRFVRLTPHAYLNPAIPEEPTVIAFRIAPRNADKKLADVARELVDIADKVIGEIDLREVKINGHTAVRLEYLAEPKDGGPRRTRVRFFIDAQDQLYQVTGHCDPKAAEEMLPNFDRVADSFQIRPNHDIFVLKPGDRIDGRRDRGDEK